MSRRIRLGVSSCLLGDEVRWNGAHKRDDYCVEVLGRFFELVPVCPELEMGLGVPREPIHLQGGRGGLRLIGNQSGTDHTEAARAFAARRLEELRALELSGYCFKKDSPSCGVWRVRVDRGSGTVSRDGAGVFAAAFREAFPLVPVEEEGRLHDESLRASFVERVFCHDRLLELGRGFSRGALVEFHARHKMLLFSHGQVRARALGRLVGTAKGRAPRALYETYAEGFMKALEPPATVQNHRNVLEHMLGHLREHLDGDDRRELLDAIGGFAAGRLPRVVPLTLLRHHVRRHAIATLATQVYLDPHPSELLLRNRA